jgi:hypothetical protein
VLHRCCISVSFEVALISCLSADQLFGSRWDTTGRTAFHLYLVLLQPRHYTTVDTWRQDTKVRCAQ